MTRPRADYGYVRPPSTGAVPRRDECPQDESRMEGIHA